MFRIVLISAILALAAAQQGYYNRDPKTAAILSEQRYQQGDGKFGAAYTQEDGTDFKEETDADGTRRGSYSYIDPSGAKKTVSYTAGKHGFVASGDHLPVAPPAPPQPIPQAQYQPQYQGQPQYKAAPTYDRGDEANFDDGSYDERHNDPSFSGNGGNTGYRAPAPVPQHQVYKPAPQPQYHQQPAAPQPQYHQQPAAPQPQYHQQQAPQQHYQPAPQPAYNQYTTEAPHRFQPPGKLSLNRTPDGFSYSFNKA